MLAAPFSPVPSSQPRCLGESSIRIELLKLSQKARIGSNNWARTANNLLRLVQAGVARAEEIGEQEEGRPGDSVDAMNQNSSVAKSGGMDKIVHLPDVLGHVLVVAVRKVEDEVAQFPELFFCSVVDADNMSDPVPPQLLQVDRVLGAPDEKPGENLGHASLANVAQPGVESLAERHFVNLPPFYRQFSQQFWVHNT